VLAARPVWPTPRKARLRGQSWDSLVDAALIDMDGTSNKSRLGANAIVGVSMAAARALARRNQQPLCAYLRGTGGGSPRLPVQHYNGLNGGAHAPNVLEFQEFVVAPVGAPSMPEAVRAGAEVYAALRARLRAAGCRPDWATRAASRRRSTP
jgi:enolase